MVVFCRYKIVQYSTFDRTNEIITNIIINVIFLQIGGNDIQGNLHNGIYIGNSVVDLAKHILRSTSCQKLYIGEMIFRFKGKYIKSVAEQDAYNTEVHAANCEIKSQLGDYNDIIVWPCKGVKRDRQLVMHHDGCHLSERNGMFKYYKSVRGAIVHALKRI